MTLYKYQHQIFLSQIKVNDVDFELFNLVHTIMTEIKQLWSKISSN
jgi:hypothetical protein